MYHYANRIGWLGSTKKFGFERGTDFSKKLNFGALYKAGRCQMPQKSTSAKTSQIEFSTYQ